MDQQQTGESQESLAAPARQAGFGFVFITVVLDMLAIGLIVPVLPNLVTRMAGGGVHDAALWIGAFSAGWATMQFLFMPLLGAWSDAHGRKGVFLFSNFGQAAACALTALAPNFAILALARLLSGAVSASVSTAYAYVADITPAHERAARFGQLGAAFGLGFVLGPAVGGLLAKIDLHLPFWVAAGMATLNGIYGLLVLPESLPKDRRTPFALARANPVASFGFLAGQRNLVALTGIKALVDLAHTSLPSTFVLYGLYRYGWQADTTGLTLTMVGIMSMVVQGGLTGRIIRRIGERRGLVLGLCANLVAFIGYGAAPQGWMFWLVIPVASFGGLVVPSVQSLLTRRVQPDEQGRLQGALGAVQALMGIGGPVMFTAVFAYFIDPSRSAPVPGAALFLAGGLTLTALLLALRFARRHPQETSETSGPGGHASHPV
jgi:MFS transporter, DHA1 family, tetracycline resistance protein